MKRIIMLLLCLLLPLAMWGCSSAKAEQEGMVNQEGAELNTQIGDDTVYGKVESIVGNEVTLALGEPQQSTASSISAQEGERMQVGESPTASGEKPSFGSGERPTGQMPSGERPGNGQMPSGGKTVSGDEANVVLEGQPVQQGSAAMGRSVSLTYSGETATYLLPVGMSIGSGDFSNISEGMVLALSFNAEGDISAVRILAS